MRERIDIDSQNSKIYLNLNISNKKIINLFKQQNISRLRETTTNYNNDFLSYDEGFFTSNLI